MRTFLLAFSIVKIMRINLRIFYKLRMKKGIKYEIIGFSELFLKIII